jgi:hypothetical protein
LHCSSPSTQLPPVVGGCISKWHGIEKGRALNIEKVDFVVALIMGRIEEQMNEKGGKSV